MYDLGTLFSGLSLSEEDLGGLLEEDGDYGATERAKKRRARRKTRRKTRVTARKARRAGRKKIRASGLKGKARRDARRASQAEARATKIAARKAAGLRTRKTLLGKRRKAAHKKAMAAHQKRSGCPQGHKRFKGKCVPLNVYAKLLGTKSKREAARKAANTTVRTALPTTSAEALAAASATASYDNYAPSASYQDEAYSEQAYSEQTYTETPSYDTSAYDTSAYDTSSYSSEMPDSGAYWEGGGTQVASYTPASIEGGEEGYEDEEYEEEGSNMPLILGAVAVLALGGVGFYVYKKKQAGTEEGDEPTFPETLSSEEEGA